MQTALALAREACETMMRKFAPEDLPPKGRFHYHQGVFLSGVLETWKLTGDRRYFEYAKAWVDSLIDESGSVRGYHRREMDDLQPGVLLYPILAETGDARYRKALDELCGAFREYPRNKQGGLWHKENCPNQMWLDGLYMGGPICAQYAKLTGDEWYYDLVVEQARMMRDNTREEATGLWKHAYDEARVMPWADKETGRSPEFWGRSMGWVPVGLMDDIAAFPEGDARAETLIALLRELLSAVARVQDEDSGLWYQVLNKGEQPGNWLESSCTCLFASAMFRGHQKGYLSEEYLHAARRGFAGVIERLERDENGLLIGNICIGTGVGDYAFYCARPTSVNDLHGVGAFLLMCAAASRSGM